MVNAARAVDLNGQDHDLRIVTRQITQRLITRHLETFSLVRLTVLIRFGSVVSLIH